MPSVRYKKIIIWGYPLYSHTHSYVHESYFEAFKFLGYDVYWFHDGQFPTDFDYSDCLFITEGFADKNIPLVKSSCYCVMYCPSPLKYIQAGVRYIDVRCAAKNHVDHIHNYSLDKSASEKIGPACYLERKTNNTVHIKNNYHDYHVEDFDKLYLSWATNLLPHEFNFDDIHIEREAKIYFCGTMSTQGVCENVSNWNPFIEKCRQNGIQFIHNCPWRSPLSSDQVKELTQRSYLGIDIRCKEHVNSGIVTCRVFKNVSYGHLGLTNSEEIYKEMDGNCVYSPNSAELFELGQKHRHDFSFIKAAMLYTQENHTYINRINSILSII